jgi:Rps23 Pro-64 3,4-dihydroxylase Tpa1-like proline 4-hydroxylase
LDGEVMTKYTKSDIIQYDNFFSKEDYIKILEKTHSANWEFGHGSYHPSDPNYHKSFPFWLMRFEEDKFFTEHLLNIIEEKTNSSYEVYDVYANGHTFGTKGSFHEDWYDDSGRTFLYYVNHKWDLDWGGKTIFNFGDGEYYFNVPRPNSAVLFPGIISHAAEGPTRSFSGLRITIAWKLLLK